MTIRSKLTLFITAMLAASLGVFAALIARHQGRRLRAENDERREIVLGSVRRAAADALLQKDDLLLFSTLKFLQGQFPSLAYCKVRVREGSAAREHHIGPRSFAGAIEAHPVEVSDPSDPARRIRIEVGLNLDATQRRLAAELAELRHGMLQFFLLALASGAGFSALFARGLTRPLAALSKAASEIGAGRQGVRLEWRSKDEIGSLVRSFNRMSERLEELDAMKKDFVSSVTHELRSPLGAIESFLNLIESRGSGAAPQQQREYLGRIKANVRRLSGFINDLLDVAKIERGKMECALRPVRAQELAHDVVLFFEGKAREQGVALESLVPGDLPPVQADPDRLRQVLVNLVANALKFTPRGGRVEVSGRRLGHGQARKAELSVSDTGAGMEPGELARLFQKFSQGKSPVLAGSKGTGLGLFIVKSIVEAHGGSVGAESKPGRGSRFHITLNLA